MYKDNDAKTDPELWVMEDITPVVHHSLVECIYTEGDQDGRNTIP